MMKDVREKELVDGEYTVPVESPIKKDGSPIELSKTVPVSVFSGRAVDKFNEAIDAIDKVEDGLVRYTISYPMVSNRYVLANKYFNPEKPAFLTIVSGKYRVIRSREALETLRDAFNKLENKSGWGILTKVSSSLSFNLTNSENRMMAVIYSNSYDRSIRESIILPGLVSLKYTHTRKGTNKDGLDEAIASALDISSVSSRYELLAKHTISKRAILRFVIKTMSMTRRSVVRKFFGHDLVLSPDKDISEAFYENLFFDIYFGKYGKSLNGFARFVYDAYDYFVKEGKVTKGLLVLQSGTGAVKTALSM